MRAVRKAFDPFFPGDYGWAVDKGFAKVRELMNLEQVLEAPLPRSYIRPVGQFLLGLGETARGIVSFALITLGVVVTKSGEAPAVIRPLIRAQIAKSGLRLLPMVGFLALALGFVVIGQTVALLTQYGAQDMMGTIMVTVVVRELGPLVTALVVLMRVGTATVIELGTARALGEVEALEAMAIDPVHYLVVPRVLGIAASVAALTSYLILGAILSGYVFAFVQDVPVTPGEYFRQLALALTWQDFLLLGLKTLSFGSIIAVVTCYQGLARPLELAEVAQATTAAVVASTVCCVMLDACFILVYLAL